MPPADSPLPNGLFWTWSRTRSMERRCTKSWKATVARAVNMALEQMKAQAQSNGAHTGTSSAAHMQIFSLHDSTGLVNEQGQVFPSPNRESSPLSHPASCATRADPRSHPQSSALAHLRMPGATCPKDCATKPASVGPITLHPDMTASDSPRSCPTCSSQQEKPRKPRPSRPQACPWRLTLSQSSLGRSGIPGELSHAGAPLAETQTPCAPYRRHQR